MPSDFPPFTPGQLERAVRRRACLSLQRLGALIDDSARTPYWLRKPYDLDPWVALTPTERNEHARKILKRQAFDAFVARRGVILDDGTLL